MWFLTIFRAILTIFRAKNVPECTRNVENLKNWWLFSTFSAFVENSGTFLTFVKNTGTFPVHSGIFLQNFIPGKSGRFSENFWLSKIFDFWLSGIVESLKFLANAWPYLIRVLFFWLEKTEILISRCSES